MAEIASAAIAFAAATHGAVSVIQTLITDYNNAIRVLSNLNSHCTTIMNVLRTVRETLETGPLTRTAVGRGMIETFNNYYDDFETRLQEVLTEVRSYGVLEESQPGGRRPSSTSLVRIRIMWRSPVLETMKRDIDDKRSNMVVLMISIQL